MVIKHINGSFKLIVFNSMSRKTFEFKSIPHQLGLVDYLVLMINDNHLFWKNHERLGDHLNAFLFHSFLFVVSIRTKCGIYEERQRMAGVTILMKFVQNSWALSVPCYYAVDTSRIES